MLTRLWWRNFKTKQRTRHNNVGVDPSVLNVYVLNDFQLLVDNYDTSVVVEVLQCYVVIEQAKLNMGMSIRKTNNL